VKLRKVQPTTIAGVTAVAAYFVEHIDRYPDCGWISDEKMWDDEFWFEHGLMRSLAALLKRESACRTCPALSFRDVLRHLERAHGTDRQGGHQSFRN
jgi:hypothetical protein